jgi:phospholipid/cholesterol/gamma-HCH transport system substrate-binding protein
MEISSRNRPVKVTVFLMLGLALSLILFIFYMLGSNQRLFSHSYTLHMFVTDAKDLKSGSFITLGGVKVGVVGHIQFHQRNGESGVLIDLKIGKKYADLITESSIASLETKGVLGSKYVNITFGQPGEKALANNSYIQSQPGTSTTEAFAAVARTVGELSGTIRKIDRVLEEVLQGQGVLGMLIKDETARKELSRSLANVNYISQHIAGGEGNLGKLVRDTVFYHSLANTSRNLNEITRRIKAGEGTLGKIVTDQTLYSRLDRITVLTDTLLFQLNHGGTMSKLIREKEVYNQLVELMKNLDELTTEIKKNPKKYFNLKIF